MLGIDAASPELLERWAAEGRLPAIAALLDAGAVARTRGIEGFFIGATWPSLSTGVGPASHGIHYLAQLRPGSYSYEHVADRPERREPFWTTASRAGRNVAVLDVPLSRLAPDLNGIQIVEWGAHDSMYGFQTTPAGLRDEIVSTSGSTRRREPATVPVARLGTTRRSSTASCAERRSRAASQDRCSRGAAGISSSRSSRRLIARATSAGISTTPGIRGTTAARGGGRRPSAPGLPGGRYGDRRDRRGGRGGDRRARRGSRHGLSIRRTGSSAGDPLPPRCRGASRRGGGTPGPGRALARRAWHALPAWAREPLEPAVRRVVHPRLRTSCPACGPTRRGASASRSRTGFPSAASASTLPGASRPAGSHRVSSPTASATGSPPT